MADSLFDNRYRYDHIYPRGRSGETLRAVDTQNKDRPVVIKRPAPGDAPPIRGGQEVSILNERRALTRLGGHPVLTELLDEGQFSVGGQEHQYIVMERAEGEIVADIVMALAAQGERLPELETLVIVDRLLDLLVSAHAKDIVYNDVDVKHLFWDRTAYNLKVIDWGNAIFLEGDEVTPQGISRQSDIYQVGELLYFILTGGRRPDVPRDAAEDFALDFGEDSANIAPILQAVISKAMHPNKRYRYTYTTELRRDLADYRGPQERERDGIISRINERMRQNLSKNELQNLLTTLETASVLDPGFPAARRTEDEISTRLRDLDVAAGLDAVRIYLESANWSRAVDVLSELREQAGPGTRTMVNLLLDCAILLLDANISDEREGAPTAIAEAVRLMFENKVTDAARVLLTYDTPDDDTRRVQWLLAERISSHIPEALLLRPNLYRLELALASLAREGFSLEESRTLLGEIRTMLDRITQAGNVASLRDRYREVVDRLSALNNVLSTFAVQHALSNRKLPLSSLDRALNAAMNLADNMHVIGKQATSSPRDAMAALDNSRAIDPTTSVWDSVANMLDNLYEHLQSYQTYVPAANGSDLESWLRITRDEIAPFLQSLFDEMLVNMAAGLDVASAAWDNYESAVIQGDRASAIDALTEAIESVTTISPTLAGWLNQLRSVIEGAQYVERHAIFGGLGRALADGWQAFDRSRMGEAERLGQQADGIARNEQEKFAANRLREVARLAREWVERNAAPNVKRTKATLDAVEALYTDEENQVRRDFNTQMPSRETYLRAMPRGIVETYARRSSAALRILAFNYVLLGTLDAHSGLLDDAVFWREAAVKTLGDHGTSHTLVRTLDEFTDRRRDLNRIAALLEQVNHSDALDDLAKTRRLIEENPQAKLVSGALLSLRELEVALRDWAEGEFRTAGLKLNTAHQSLVESETSAAIEAPAYREWLETLQQRAAELHVAARDMRQAIERRPTEPEDLIGNAHHKMAQVTQDTLGNDVAATIVQWRDLYERFLSIYTDPSTRRSQKLEQFNELFHAMFIDRHPAYTLYRHWYDVVESSPEFPAPPTDDPTPRMNEDDDGILDHDFERSDESAPPQDSPPRPEREPGTGRRRRPRGLIVIGLVLILVVIAAVMILNGPGTGGGDAASGAVAETQTAVAALAADDATAEPAITTDAAGPTATLDLDVVTQASATIDLTLASEPTDEPDPPTATAAATDVIDSAAAATELPIIEPTATETPTETPTETTTPTATLTPSSTPTITPSATATLPPQGLQGQQEMLPRFAGLDSDEVSWSSDVFSLGDDEAFWRLGMGAQTAGDEIRIAMPPDLLESWYGNDAASRIRRVEADMTLLTFDPQLPQEEVYFGLMVTREDSGSGVAETGLFIQVVDLQVMNLYQRTDDTQDFIDQRSVNQVRARFRIDRDTNSGTLSFYVNDNLVGQSVNFGEAETPLIPALFIKDGGVLVGVNNWRVTLR